MSTKIYCIVYCLMYVSAILDAGISGILQTSWFDYMICPASTERTLSNCGDIKNLDNNPPAPAAKPKGDPPALAFPLDVLDPSSQPLSPPPRSPPPGLLLPGCHDALTDFPPPTGWARGGPTGPPESPSSSSLSPVARRAPSALRALLSEPRDARSTLPSKLLRPCLQIRGHMGH